MLEIKVPHDLNFLYFLARYFGFFPKSLENMLKKVKSEPNLSSFKYIGKYHIPNGEKNKKAYYIFLLNSKINNNNIIIKIDNLNDILDENLRFV